ncbi:Putative ankyrin repeat-containing domain superfamily [Septoria linicola]|uniref:Ankyrin repeat-containing domain superfamily n=1 Tax=Septoria linicola TaxID=215465 RepID=A0A9Q9AMI9_9PEZI|nr:putative ankyrin repeat-containing domain superfamily [Septoria linicola]USW52207.1 Putative ankyrin repeat-containing domain superfamily [Septoria linicola]
MNLCSDEAYQARTEQCITDAEYLHEVLSHFGDVRHPSDAVPARSWQSMVSDPVGNATREAVLQLPIARPEHVALLERLFASVLPDDVSEVRAIVSQLQGDSDHYIPVQAIATFAASHNHVEVLRLCLRLGASLEDRNTTLALEYTTRGPALLDLLYERDWRGMRTSRLVFDRTAEWSLKTGPEELCWFLDHGAIINRNTVRRAVQGSFPKGACVQLLLDRYGLVLFKNTGLLQNAARRGRNDVVRLLLDAGMDVDECAVRSEYSGREARATALYEAVDKQHLDTVRLLLAYGADPARQVGSELTTPIELSQEHDHAEILSLLRRYAKQSRL